MLERAHEPNETRTGGVVAFAAGLIVCVVAVMLISRAVMPWLRAAAPPGPSPPSRAGVLQLPPEPRLQVSPHDDLREMRAREDRILGSYGWVDRPAGRVRIPIERAMDLVVHEGLK